MSKSKKSKSQGQDIAIVGMSAGGYMTIETALHLANADANAGAGADAGRLAAVKAQVALTENSTAVFVRCR